MVALHLLIYFIMEDLKVFSNEEFGQLQVKTSEENELYFNATHVCAALGLANATIAVNSLDEDEVAKFNLGSQGETWFVNESGLYHLIFKSRKPFAKKFRKWVTSEVLPSIRRTGTYTLPAATEMFPLYQDVLLTRYSGKKRERVLVLMEKLTPIVPSFPKGEWIFLTTTSTPYGIPRNTRTCNRIHLYTFASKP